MHSFLMYLQRTLASAVNPAIAMPMCSSILNIYEHQRLLTVVSLWKKIADSYNGCTVMRVGEQSHTLKVE